MKLQEDTMAEGSSGLCGSKRIFFLFPTNICEMTLFKFEVILLYINCKPLKINLRIIIFVNDLFVKKLLN